jgi:hypothetical protein
MGHPMILLKEEFGGHHTYFRRLKSECVENIAIFLAILMYGVMTPQSLCWSCMKNRRRCTDEPMGELRVVKDFLPKPEQLVLKEENVKITISLNKSSVDFFKEKAKENHTSYQKMIRRLIDWYASQQRKSA